MSAPACCLLLQEEVELRASVLRVHRLAAATRSRSSPLPGFDMTSSSADSSKPGSRESSADQAAALARALTVANPAAATAEHGCSAAAAALEQDAAAGVGSAAQQQMPLSSSGSLYRRAMTWAAELDSKGGEADQFLSFLYAGQNITDLPAVAAAIAALDERPSALYKAAADALGSMGKAVGAAAVAVGEDETEEGAGMPNRCKPRVSFAISAEGSWPLQEQLCNCGRCKQQQGTTYPTCWAS